MPNITHSAIDQRCWIEEDCKQFRKEFGNTDAQGGFFNGVNNEMIQKACGVSADGKDITGRTIGFCLPAGKSVTAVSFAGKNSFENLGEFINFIYKYGLQIGSVVAVIVIIIAGIMYIFSGGNSDTVGQAKNKIAGAVIGLILMALAYTILTNINPYLVKLEMPDIWAINKLGIAPANCESLADNSKLATSTNSNTVSFIEKKNMTTICGQKYIVDGTGGQTCQGNQCPQDGNVCYTKLHETTQSCHPANVAGIVYASSLMDNFIQGSGALSLASTLIGDGFEWTWLTGERYGDIELFGICNNGKFIRVKDTTTNQPQDASYRDDQKLKQEYWLIAEDAKNWTKEKLDIECNSYGGFKGFAFYLSFNEESDPINENHFLGIDKKSGKAVDIGRHRMTAGEVNTDGDDVTPNIFAKNCVNKYLITLDELKKGIYLPVDISNVCDIETGDEGESLRKKCYSFVGYGRTPEQCQNQN